MCFCSHTSIYSSHKSGCSRTTWSTAYVMVVSTTLKIFVSSSWSPIWKGQNVILVDIYSSTYFLGICIFQIWIWHTHAWKTTQSLCWNEACLVILVFCFFAMVIEIDESHVQRCPSFVCSWNNGDLYSSIISLDWFGCIFKPYISSSQPVFGENFGHNMLRS